MSSTSVRLVVLVALAALLAAPAAAGQQRSVVVTPHSVQVHTLPSTPHYTITPLGADATAIGPHGEVAFLQGTQSYLFTPTVPNGSQGSVAPLGTLGGTTSVAHGVNAAAHVTGFATLSNGHYRAFLYSDGEMFDIGTLSGDFSAATGLNDAGQVVGFSYGASGDEHGFLWTPVEPNGTVGSMIDVGTLGGEYSEALGVNAQGVVVGYAYTLQGAFHAYRYAAGAMTDLGTLGGSYSRANAINASGKIVGQAYLPGNFQAHACVWDGAAATDLGSLHGPYSEALAIDSSGKHIVGKANVPGGPFLVDHAVLWTHGTITDINTVIPAGSGWVLQVAEGLNDAGQIVGQGELNGEARGFLLTP
jgi:probable HAF family extracellular repeat protein